MIIGILGSASSDSLTRKGLQEVASQIRAAGLEFDLIDLRTEYQQLQDIDNYHEPAADSQTSLLRQRLAGASGVILASPVYHGSYSGLLKNALDQLCGDAFANLPVGILAAGGGPRSASVACDQLRSVVRALCGWSTPTHVGMTYGDITDDGPTEDLRERIADLVQELRAFTLHKTAHKN